MNKKMNNRRFSMGSGEVVMWVAGVLFCLVLITRSMMGGLFARYTTSGSGYDHARVIRFGDIYITETGDFVGSSNKLLITPGVDIAKKAVVQFEGSEAATYVFLEVNCSEGWTAEDGVFSNNGKLTWQIADGWKALGNNVFYRILVTNESLEADIIRDGVIHVSPDISNSEIRDLSCTISFRASAVQSHGFENAEAAWESLQNQEVQ